MLFPAHAGVILVDILVPHGKSTVPRTRGGDPCQEISGE